MADGLQSAMVQYDDELDFRPQAGQTSPRRSATEPRSVADSDAIDFKPAGTSTRAPRVASPASPGIDFRPADKPLTFDELYKAPRTGPSPAARAARIGQPSPEVQAVLPHQAGLTLGPRFLFMQLN